MPYGGGFPTDLLYVCGEIKRGSLHETYLVNEKRKMMTAINIFVSEGGEDEMRHTGSIASRSHGSGWRIENITDL